MQKRGKLLLRFLILILGIAFMGVGIGAYIACGLGGDPPSVLLQGVHFVLKVSYTTATWLVMGIALVADLLFFKKYIGIGTFCNAILLGVFVDIANYFYAFLPDQRNFIFRFMLATVGVVILGFGVGLYLSVDLGAGPLDIMVLAIVEKTEKPLALIRLIQDAVVTLIGFVLGGIVGVGTLLGVVFTGLIIQQTLKKVKPHIEKLKGG